METVNQKKQEIIYQTEYRQVLTLMKKAQKSSTARVCTNSKVEEVDAQIKYQMRLRDDIKTRIKANEIKLESLQRDKPSQTFPKEYRIR